jgi:co-chaperonin GroES (HSP10)
MTAGGIVLPDTIRGSQYGDKLVIGYVLKVGPGGWADGVYYPVDVEPGDRVLVEYDCGQDVVVGEHIAPESATGFEPGTELRVVRASEILAIL